MLGRSRCTSDRVVAPLALSARMRVIFPVHPRTEARLRQWRFLAMLEAHSIELGPPLGYLEMARHLSSARLVMTDSGGLQDECAILGVPCITVRSCTERPITVSCGANRIAGTSAESIAGAIDEVLAGPERAGPAPPLWDGDAAERIVDVLLEQPGQSAARRSM